MTGGTRQCPDVIVVGGGPAGSIAARHLALRGHTVRLLDRARFPREKACGEFLNPGAVSLLHELGLATEVRELGPERIRGWELRAGPGGEAASGSYPGDRFGWGLPRSEFDTLLLRAAGRAGAEVTEGCLVAEALPARPGVGEPTHGHSPADGPAGLPSVRLQDGTVLRARAVIGADGLRSRVARSLDAHRRGPKLRKVSVSARMVGIEVERARGRLYLGTGPGGGFRTVGVAATGGTDRGWNVTVVVDAEAEGRELAGDPEAFHRRILREVGAVEILGGSISGAARTSGPFDWPVTVPGAPGILLAGDAAGYYDPLTGQGIHGALASGLLAAVTVDTALLEGRLGERHLERYGTALRTLNRPRHRLQRMIEFVLSRPALRYPAVTVLRGWPALLDGLLGWTGDLPRNREHLSPLARAGLSRLSSPHPES